MEENMISKLSLRIVLILAMLTATVGTLSAADNDKDKDKNQDAASCAHLPGFAALKAAIDQATSAETSGLNNQMWATIVSRDGVVCAVAFSGVNRGAQWPGSA